jgi:hypothetical protein
LISTWGGGIRVIDREEVYNRYPSLTRFFGRDCVDGIVDSMIEGYEGSDFSIEIARARSAVPVRNYLTQGLAFFIFQDLIPEGSVAGRFLDVYRSWFAYFESRFGRICDKAGGRVPVERYIKLMGNDSDFLGALTELDAIGALLRVGIFITPDAGNGGSDGEGDAVISFAIREERVDFGVTSRVRPRVDPERSAAVAKIKRLDIPLNDGEGVVVCISRVPDPGDEGELRTLRRIIVEALPFLRETAVDAFEADFAEFRFYRDGERFNARDAESPVDYVYITAGEAGDGVTVLGPLYTRPNIYPTFYGSRCVCNPGSPQRVPVREVLVEESGKFSGTGPNVLIYYTCGVTRNDVQNVLYGDGGAPGGDDTGCGDSCCVPRTVGKGLYKENKLDNVCAVIWAPFNLGCSRSTVDGEVYGPEGGVVLPNPNAHKPLTTELYDSLAEAFGPEARD